MPILPGAFIPLEDGTLLAAPPAKPPPPPSPAPPPPLVPPAQPASSYDPALLAAAGVTAAQVAAAEQASAAAAAGAAALASGQGSPGIAAAEQAAGASQGVVDALLALGIPDLTVLVVGGPGTTGDDVTGTDDLVEAGAVAEANTPDLSDLPELELLDPFTLSELAVTNPPLKGGGAITAIAQACSDFGVDALAAIADALHEGANGGIGDGGKSYGPFQLEIGGRLPEPFASRGRNNLTTNAWAWSENGIRYAVRGMTTVTPSARGLHGHPAVYAIVYGFELPADKPGAYKTRAAEYNHLVALGKQWPAYAADLFKGPAAGGGVDSRPIPGSSAAPYQPAGVVAQWRELVDVFKLSIPSQHKRVSSIADSLVEVFK